jgi:hypothetical protein
LKSIYHGIRRGHDLFSRVVGRRARGRLPDADFVDLNSIRIDLPTDFGVEELREVLGRRVEVFVEGRKLVDVLVIEVVDDALGRFLELAKIDEEADVVESLAADVDLDLIIVAVRVLTLAAIAAERMGARKLHLDTYFMHWQPSMADRVA